MVKFLTKTDLKTNCEQLIKSLKDLIEAIGVLEVFTTENWQVQNHYSHALKCLKKVDDAIARDSFTCIENAIREFDEDDDIARYKACLDYFEAAPASDQRDEAFGLADEISLTLIELMGDLKKLKKFF